MKRLSLYALLLFLLVPSCSPKSGSTLRVVKPAYHHRWYDRKKDKHVKRVKMIKVRN